MSRWPWWVQVLAVHAGARAVSAVVFVVVGSSQLPGGWVPVPPSYLEYTGLMWDASWYRQIAESGYPEVLPVGEDGRVLQNAWAFYPLFPVLARGAMALTGAPWHVAAPLLATALAGLAMLVVHQVLAHAVQRPAGLPVQVRRWLPLVGVALLSTWASAPVLQTAYTESLALLLLAAALWALQRERYALTAVASLGLGLTRAVALPLTLAVLAHAVVRWRGWPARRRWAAGGLAGVVLLSGLAWPALAAVVTGRLDAYTATQGAWRGRAAVVPLVPWLDVARWLFGGWGVVLLAAVLGGLVLLVASRPLRRLGAELWAWTAGYLGWLLVAVEPGTSLVRFSLLAFPVVGVLAQGALGARRPARAVGALVALGVIGQVAWIGLVWRFVPPAGWPP